MRERGRERVDNLSFKRVSFLPLSWQTREKRDIPLIRRTESPAKTRWTRKEVQEESILIKLKSSSSRRVNIDLKASPFLKGSSFVAGVRGHTSSRNKFPLNPLPSFEHLSQGRVSDHFVARPWVSLKRSGGRNTAGEGSTKSPNTNTCF